jgi:hypothetical protein
MIREREEISTKQARRITIGSVNVIDNVFSSIVPLSTAYTINAAPYMARDFQ